MDAKGTRRWVTFACAVALVAACGAAEDAAPTPTAPMTGPAEDGTAPPAPTGTAPPGTAADDAQSPAADVVIVISDFGYAVPDSVPAGSEVTVTNEDGVGHTVTSDDDGLFDVAVDPGATVTFTAPEDPGEYGFFCIPHPHMTATLVVG